MKLHTYIEKIPSGETRYIWYKYNFSDARFNYPHKKKTWEKLVNFKRALTDGRLIEVVKTADGGIVGKE